MIAPHIAAVYWLRTLGIGGILGVIYGFLRPLRPRLTALADGIFILAALVGWVYMVFGICSGECRIGCVAALFLGVWIWDITVGRLLKPVFSLFWKEIEGAFKIIFFPFRKIFHYFHKFYKFLLAKLKKSVTIEGTITQTGGAHHGKGKPPRQIGAEKDQSHHKSRHSGRRRAVRGGAGRPVQLHRSASRPV